MDKKSVVYFAKVGPDNTDSVLTTAHERLKEGGINSVVIATHRGKTAIKAAEMFGGLGLNMVAVTVNAGTKPDVLKEWDGNVSALENLGVKTFRGMHALSGVERAIRARWGGVGPVILMADTLRILGEGTKVGIEVLLMATDAGLVKSGEKVMVIAGSSRGADTCMVAKAAGSSKFFDLAIQEYVCKPSTDGVKHEAR